MSVVVVIVVVGLFCFFFSFLGGLFYLFFSFLGGLFYLFFGLFCFFFGLLSFLVRLLVGTLVVIAILVRSSCARRRIGWRLSYWRFGYRR